MHWEPLTQSNVIQVLSSAVEQTVFDFKQEYDLSEPTTKWEISKDIAAFANNMGGTILVGAIEGDKGRVAKFKTVQGLPKLVKAINAALERCRPVPVVVPAAIRLSKAQQVDVLGREDDDDVDLVAINVQPSLATPVGAPTCDGDGNLISDAYRFPIRTVEGTRFQRPEELAFHVNSAERRALIQLQKISADDRKKLKVWSKRVGAGLTTPRKCELTDVDGEHYTLGLSYSKDGKCYPATVPLVFVQAIWRVEGLPNIAIDGAVFEFMGGRGHSGFVPLGSSFE